MAINPNAYMAVVDTWRPQTKQFKEAFDDYKRWAGAPAGTEWTGRTANAAYEAAATDCHGSDNADDAAEDIVRLASATITHEVLPPLNNGKAMIENALRAKDQGVSIDQSFNMSYTPPEGMSEETAATNRQHVEEAERQIKEYVAKWEKGCQTLKGQADAAAQKITGCINPKTALVDGRKILRDAVGSKPGDGPATATATTVSATSGKPHGMVQGMQDIAGAGDTKPAGTTGAETVADYKKWYPKDAVNVGDKNVDPAKLGGAGSIPGVRDNSERTPQALQRPVLRPEQVEQFKADTRRALYEMKVPPDQIEARVNAAVQDAQTPHFKPDAPSASPTDPKYISRDFGEQFNRFTNGISDSAQRTVDGQIEQAKILTGQAGPGAPGVAEAWKQVGLGAIQQAHELTTDPLAAPKMGIEQAKDFYNNPSDFIGKNIIHGTEALATGAIGGEAAAGARGLLGDLTGTEGRALTHGIDNGAPHAGLNVPERLHEPVSGPVEPPSGPTHPAPGSDHSPPTEHHTPTGDSPDQHVPTIDVAPPSVSDISNWLHEINNGPGMDPYDPARAVNCGQCALAVDQRLSGATPDATAGHGTLSIEEMEAATGRQQVAATPSEIEKYLVDQGPGSHTVVGVDRSGDMAGHWFNAYYDGKNVYAIDGQTNEIIGWPPDMDMPGYPVTNWDMGVPRK
nr:toxin glutamine deamidase domain-containing protein [Mycobacteroides abscessus]